VNDTDPRISGPSRSKDPAVRASSVASIEHHASPLTEDYRRMLAIRLFEERAQTWFHASKIRGSIHLGIGQEAVAVGARRAMSDGDIVAATYRGHAWALAWGVSLEAGFAELLGRETGANRGRGGSKHVGDWSVGVLPGNAIVGATLPIAVGTALADRLAGLDRVSIAVLGDGAMNQAVVHEAMNLAAVWHLPVIFMLENNRYSEMTPIEDAIAIARLADRADAYGMPGVQVDGMDVEAVTRTVSEAQAGARAGEGPTLIEALTYRFCGHMPGDTEEYRSRDEVARWRRLDPLIVARTRLLALGLHGEDIAAIDDAVAADIEAAAQAAESASPPPASTIGHGAAPWMEWER
jgi:TPP-dependent pyruvate/acetoin dehydrogenase alpha subunit